MKKWQHKTLLLFSGALWLSVGLFLLQFGIKLVLSSITNDTPLYALLTPLTGKNENTAVLIVASGLLIGHGKARFALSKASARVIKRLKELPNPTYFTDAYGKSYLFLIIGMMCLGALIRYLQIPLDIRGFINIIIGSALIQGSLSYFRSL